MDLWHTKFGLGNITISAMDVRELIKKAFNEDLPISGGMCNSIEKAIILGSVSLMKDYVFILE